MKTKKAPSRLASIKPVAKEAAEKALVQIATELPHGAGKEFLVVTKQLDTIEEKMNLLNKEKRGCRARLKEMKIELRPYDHVRKLRKMQFEDMKSFEASVALYKDQLSMPLSVHQEVLKKEVVAQREAQREAMLDASGGDTGKEVGSGSLRMAPEKNEAFAAPQIVN